MHRLKIEARGIPIEVFSVYALSQIILAIFHEPWRDESQAWLIARDSGVWQVISTVAREEGHPALWSLLLMPLAKSGAPYWSMKALSVCIMLIAAGLFLKSHAPLWFRIIALFSSCFFYWTSVVSRSYCLIVLAMALLAFLYPKRITRPWMFALVIASMFQIHAVVFGFAGALALVHAFELYEHGRKAWPFILPMISAVIAFFELVGGMDKAFALPENIYEYLLHLVSGQYPTSGFLGTWGADWIFTFVAVIVFVILVSLTMLSPRVGFVQWCGLFWFLFVHLIIHPLGSLQKVSAWLCLFLLIPAFTSELAQPRPARHSADIPCDAPWRTKGLFSFVSSMILVPCLLTVPATLRYAYMDIREPFSVGEELATLIDNVSRNNAMLIPIDDMGSQYAVSNSLPYLKNGQTMWSSSIQSTMSYATADFREYWTQHGNVSDEEAASQTAQIINESLPNRHEQMLVIACTGSGDTGLDSSFQKDQRYALRGSIRENNVDESLRGYDGIQCSVYEFSER